jgi:mono/diheme cytochrome c family protein
LHCHGVPGDGRGPTAKWINPHPRDFRKGYFKFQSVDRVAVGGAPRRPSRAGLVRTLRQGIEGTAMPSFAILPDAELETIVSYVIHLSVRGYAELTTLDEGFSLQGGALKPAAKIKDSVNDYTFAGLKVWHAANQPEAAIKVAAYPYDANDHVALKASAKRGQAIFNAVPTPEVTTGLGKILRVNAAQSKKNEDAAQQKVKDATEKKRKDALAKNPKMTKEELEAIVPDESETKLTDKELAALRLTAKEREAAIAADAASSEQVAVKLIGAPKCVSCHKNYGREALYRFDDWGTLVRPNNLYTGNLRGGKRPVDIYYRVHSGINGSGMTPFGSDYMGNEFLIWDVVNFVQALPHPAMRKALDLNID